MNPRPLQTIARQRIAEVQQAAASARLADGLVTKRRSNWISHMSLRVVRLRARLGRAAARCDGGQPGCWQPHCSEA